MGEIEDEATTRLDGNAAAGVLTQVFCGEPSGAVIVCAGCGATAAIGALPAYGLELGAILRCPHCDTAVLRLGAAGATLWLDLRGAVSLRVGIGDSAVLGRCPCSVLFPRLRFFLGEAHPLVDLTDVPGDECLRVISSCRPVRARGLPPPCPARGHRPARAA